MLIAKDKEGNRVIGYRAVREDSYFCPGCGENVIPRKGSVRIHHFAHAAECPCPYYTGETELHLEMKNYLYDYYSRAPYINRIEIEWPLDGLVADVYMEGKDGARVAIECQVSRIEDRELMRRTVTFSRQGIHVLWILAGSPELDKVISRLKNTRAAALSYSADEIEKRLQNLYYGRFYYYFKEKIYPVHMEAAEKWVGGSCDGCPKQIDCAPEERVRCKIYRPGFVSRMDKKHQITLGTLNGYKPLCIERKGGLKLARFVDRKWW